MSHQRAFTPTDAERPIGAVAAAPGIAVLRGLRVNTEPRLLPRPGIARGAPPATAPEERAGENAAPPERTPLYRLGYEAGHAAARNEFEDAARRAREEGFKAGLQEGRDRGLAEGREAGRQTVEREARAASDAAAQRLERLDALLAALPGELARRVDAAEDDMVALCHRAICRILGDALVTRDGVAHAVRQAVREATAGSPLHASGGLEIHVSPRDLDALRDDEELAAWLERTRAAPGGVRWFADERVGVGGCLVSSGEGTLDARLDTQLAALGAVLARRGEPTGDERNEPREAAASSPRHVTRGPEAPASEGA